MELKVFRDVLPAAGADCTAKAELPLETELLISDYPTCTSQCKKKSETISLINTVSIICVRFFCNYKI